MTTPPVAGTPVGSDDAARRRRRWPAAVAVLCAVLLGAGSGWWSVRHQASFGDPAGAWRVSLLAGSRDADAWTRARVAIGGLLALERSETMYFVATHDSMGRVLRSRCHYRVTGTPPPARWWSLTAYADDFFLFADDAQRYSVNGRSAALDSAGRFTLVTGPTAPVPPTRAWIPTPGDRGLMLTLRVYNPAPSLQSAPQTLDPPRIDPVGDCR